MHKLSTFRPLILAATLFAATGAAHAAEGFYDPFDRFDGKRWTVSDGWTNGAHMACIWKRDQVETADGALTLHLTRTPAETGKGEARDYVCAEIQSRAAYGYGLYETRMKSAPGSGLVSAFFTYTGPHLGDPHDEIDVEVLGRSMDRFDTNYFVDGKGENQEKVRLDTPADADFIDYAFEWTPDALRWYVDGTLVREVTSDPRPEARQKLFFSIWNGGKGTTEWLGRPDPSIEAASMAVDYVAFTPPGERCLFPTSLSCDAAWADKTENATE
ncbi:family 16 glycosylhydrolase [Acuticoccus kandeliae]|uniref:family 16 glycosylhydrolase n=1 Tax=Acuticoccus kandeliae TaxID=2073160 RepID=UPI000D3E43AD|nr:family 16 glycosylhydrolase [Acuticoccus kandeliae]